MKLSYSLTKKKKKITISDKKEFIIFKQLYNILSRMTTQALKEKIQKRRLDQK